MARGRLALLIALVVAAGIAVAVVRSGNGSASHGATASLTVGTPTSRGRGDELAVFSRRQVPSDVLPPSLRADALTLGKPEPNGVGYWRGNESRRLVHAGDAALYVWPVGEHGLCSGVVGPGGSGSNCGRWGPGPDELVPLRGSADGRSWVGGLVGRDVVGLAVRTPGLMCRGRATNSAFLCTGPGADGPISVRLRLRGGETRIRRIA